MPPAVLIPLAIGAATIGVGALEASAARRQAAAGQAQQEVALQAQERASRSAEEDAQLQATGQSTAQRLARAAGTRVLAFQGDSGGVQAGAVSSLGDTNKGLTSTLGG